MAKFCLFNCLDLATLAHSFCLLPILILSLPLTIGPHNCPYTVHGEQAFLFYETQKLYHLSFSFFTKFYIAFRVLFLAISSISIYLTHTHTNTLSLYLSISHTHKHSHWSFFTHSILSNPCVIRTIQQFFCIRVKICTYVHARTNTQTHNHTHSLCACKFNDGCYTVYNCLLKKQRKYKWAKGRESFVESNAYWYIAVLIIW